jgi:hypothetical protein
MEDVLEVFYTRPYDPRYPQVCLDEVSKQLLRDTRQWLPMEPGKPQRQDYDYERGGVVNLFLFCEPLQGRRWVDVTEQRTRTDWAHQIKELVDGRTLPGSRADSAGYGQPKHPHPCLTV